MSSRDPYAHLRESVRRHREVTTARTEAWWCVECQVHQADQTGLCPVCQVVETDLLGEVAA